jgi:hypothetical protein
MEKTAGVNHQFRETANPARSPAANFRATVRGNQPTAGTEVFLDNPSNGISFEPGFPPGFNDLTPPVMNELKARLTALGLSDEMATKALHTVADFAKTKLPENLHGMIDSVLAGNDVPGDGAAGGGLGGILGSLGGLFGSK